MLKRNVKTLAHWKRSGQYVFADEQSHSSWFYHCFSGLWLSSTSVIQAIQARCVSSISGMDETRPREADRDLIILWAFNPQFEKTDWKAKLIPGVVWQFALSDH